MVGNKKGFTLIEIIAVIVIMGIILLVVSIPVSKYIENSKIKTYQSHERNLEVATKNYMIECISDNKEGCTIPSNGNHVVISYDMLVANGYSNELEDPESDGYCNKSYVIVENNSSGVMNLEYKVCLICEEYETDKTWCN